MALRRTAQPVVAAPHQMALGGGCETSMAADRIVAHGELYMGLVEVGVGLVPGWGSCKEMVRRRISPHMYATNVNPTPFLRQAFETVGFAKVWSVGGRSPRTRLPERRRSNCAEPGSSAGRSQARGADPVERRLRAAHYHRQLLCRRPGCAGGSQHRGLFDGAGRVHREYDGHIAKKLGYILCGGELSSGQWMDEQYFLDLEAEGILSLLGQEKTQKRIWFMLENNKPLRN